MKKLEKKEFLMLQTKPYYSSDLIADGGVSAIWLKRILFLIILPFPFAIVFHKNLKIDADLFWIISVIFILSFYFFQRFMIPTYNYFRAKLWVKTVANVSYKKLLKIEIKTKYSSYFKYFPMVHYKYEVNDKLYTNDRFSFEAEKVCDPAIDPYKRTPIDDFLEKIDREGKVEIFYNPKKPQESVIMRDFSIKDKTFYIVMTVLTLVMFGLSSYYVFLYFML